MCARDLCSQLRRSRSAASGGDSSPVHISPWSKQERVLDCPLKQREKSCSKDGGRESGDNIGLTLDSLSDHVLVLGIGEVCSNICIPPHVVNTRSPPQYDDMKLRMRRSTMPRTNHRTVTCVWIFYLNPNYRRLLGVVSHQVKLLYKTRILEYRGGRHD